MVKDNTTYANNAKVGEFTKEDQELLSQVVAAINEKMKVPCTAIRKDATSASNCIKRGKCEQHCPQGIKIR